MHKISPFDLIRRVRIDIKIELLQSKSQISNTEDNFILKAV